MSAFVTVGSTRFDQLIAQILQPSTLQLLNKRLKINHLIIQYGNSETLISTDQHQSMRTGLEGELVWSVDGIQIEAFRFRQSGLSQFYEMADLVISHAGSGSIMEALRANRRLLVVINEQLMDNHQRELADAMQGLGFLNSCLCSGLNDALMEMDLTTKMKPFPVPDLTLFRQVADELMNF